MIMAKKPKQRKTSPNPPSGEDLRLNPEQRLCSKFDETSVTKFPVADTSEMGVRVADNCAEEHMM